MEPERNIEKLLKAYAKKRKGDAGEPFKLDNVTRRRLQGEVSRVAAQDERDDGEASMSMWQLFRWQWAFLVTFFLLIFFAAAIFFPAVSNIKTRGQQYAEISQLKEIGSAAQMAAEENNGKLPATLDSLTNRLGSAKILKDASGGRPFVYIAANRELDSLASNAVIAYSPSAKPNRAVLFADGRVELLDSKEFARVTNSPASATFALNRLAVNAPSAPPSSPAPTGIALANENKIQTGALPQPNAALAGVSGAFGGAAAQNNAITQPGQFKNLAANSAEVLRNFQVEQNGNAIKVVDADGSVYNGGLLVKADKLALQGKAELSERAIARKKLTNTEQKIPDTDFRVAGFNRTLQQNVVFTGNFVTLTNGDTNAQPFQNNSSNNLGINGVVQSQNDRVYQNSVRQWINNAGIYGNAVINNSNNIEINAVPAP